MSAYLHGPENGYVPIAERCEEVWTEPRKTELSEQARIEDWRLRLNEWKQASEIKQVKMPHPASQERVSTVIATGIILLMGMACDEVIRAFWWVGLIMGWHK